MTHRNQKLPRIYFDSRLARMLGVGAIVLYPFVFVAANRDDALQSNLLNHEWVHIQQIQRDGFWRFYMTYVCDFARLLLKIRDWDRAYRLIPYEREAYEHMDNITLPKGWPPPKR